jgi:hypothetical protein
MTPAKFRRYSLHETTTIISQRSFGVNPLERRSFHMYAAPQTRYRLFLTTPTIEALELRGIDILQERHGDKSCHCFEMDNANYEKFDAYIRSHNLREEGMYSNASYLLWTVLITLELRAEGHMWFDNFPQSQEPELAMELDTWRSMFTGDSFELGIKTTITTSRELCHNETTERSYGVTRQLLLVTSAIRNGQPGTLVHTVHCEL